MATSGSIDLTATGQDIITEAYERIGVIEEGGTPNANQISSAKRTLNYMMKALQGEGVNLWAIERATLFLEKNKNKYSLSSSGDHWTASYVQTATSAAASSGASTITVDSITGLSNGDNIGIELDDGTMQWTTINGAPSGSTVTLTASLTDDVNSGAVVYSYTSKTNRPMKILKAVRSTSDNSDTDIDIFTLDEYAELATKTSDGTVVNIYYDPQLGTGELYTWPESSTVKDRLTLWVQRTLEDIDTAASDDVDFPQEWYLALALGLAYLMAPKYGLTIAEKRDLERYAIYYKEIAMGFDRDPYTLIQPDDMMEL